jgi:hypothetical protein
MGQNRCMRFHSRYYLAFVQDNNCWAAWSPLGKEATTVGKVRMTEYWCVPDIQESFATVYEYTYCDECGSFDIEYASRIPDTVSKALVLIIGGSYLGAIGAVFLFNADCIVGLLIGLIGLIAFVLIGVTSRLKCRKCGNEHITSDNVLGYPENDSSVIDVPGDKIWLRAVRRKISTTRE